MKSPPGQGQYLCGKDLTAADIMMAFPLQVVQSSMGGLAEYPELDAFVGRLIGRPAYKAAVERVENESSEKYRLM